MNRQLFGGALFAAGLCGAAGAQEFTIGAQATGNYVGAYQGGARAFQINGFFDESEASQNAYARAMGSAPVLSGFADSGDTGLAYVIHFLPIYFQVTQNVDVTASWDFTGDTDGIGGGFVDSFFQIYESGSPIFLADLNDSVGSTQLSLTAGTDYFFLANALATDGTSEYSLVIPAPAGASLLALAGLAATRRRR